MIRAMNNRRVSIIAHPTGRLIGERGVNSVCPGGIETRMLDSLAAQASGGRVGTREMMDHLHPIGGIGTPNEVAELIVWLCSPCASFVTGANIPVDGGYVAQ
jgi:NAD(P)-dependent dehydrogenase (short-subunit alcohol dehydrogenase family)